MKASGKYAKVYINKSLKTITGGKVNDLRRPDVAGVLKDGGKIDVIEVLHPRQNIEHMQSKIDSMNRALGNYAGPDSAPNPL